MNFIALCLFMKGVSRWESLEDNPKEGCRVPTSGIKPGVSEGGGKRKAWGRRNRKKGFRPSHTQSAGTAKKGSEVHSGSPHTVGEVKQTW